MAVAAIYYNVGLDITDTPTQTFINDSSTTKVVFHNLISEEHQASSEVTQYPVQAGYMISNHSIRKNRIITLTGEVTDTPIVSSGFKFGGNDSKVVYSQLEAVVRNKTPCLVLTNLGKYTPVIFTQISTTQESGMMDAARIRIVGTEIVVVGQTVTNATTTVPKQVLPATADESSTAAINTVMDDQNIPAASDGVISTTSAPMGDSLSATVLSPDGVTKSDATFNAVNSGSGFDATSRYNVTLSEGGEVVSAETLNFANPSSSELISTTDAVVPGYEESTARWLNSESFETGYGTAVLYLPDTTEEPQLQVVTVAKPEVV